MIRENWKANQDANAALVKPRRGRARGRSVWAIDGFDSLAIVAAAMATMMRPTVVAIRVACAARGKESAAKDNDRGKFDLCSGERIAAPHTKSNRRGSEIVADFLCRKTELPNANFILQPNKIGRCSNRTAMDTIWNITFAILAVAAWFRARWLSARK